MQPGALSKSFIWVKVVSSEEPALQNLSSECCLTPSEECLKVKEVKT